MQVQLTVFDDTPCELGEGACWDESGALLWVDIPAGRVFRRSAADGCARRVDLGQSVGCVFPRAGGGYIAGLREGVAVFDFDRGLTGWLDRSIAGDPHTRCNDGAIDRRGRLWVGLMRDDQAPGSGSLLCVESGSPTRVVREGLTVPNGLAWSGDGRVLYHVDSARRVIEALEFDEERGTVGPVFAEIRTPGAWGYPDGMTIDDEGHLWVAHWAGGRVSRWDPESGECVGEITVPARNVTSCAFGGEDLGDLYITSARDGGGSGGEVRVCRPGPLGQRPPALPYKPHGPAPRSKDRA